MEQDRVNYSFGFKANLGNYESADFHISFSTDVKSKESADDALERAIEFVERKAEAKLNELRSLKHK